MEEITITGLGEYEELRLRKYAEFKGCSVNELAKEILSEALNGPPRDSADLVAGIRAIVEPLGGIELELPPTSPFLTLQSLTEPHQCTSSILTWCPN